MSDFKTVLCEDSRIADISPEETFGVLASAAQSTYQQFQAVSASNSSIVFNIQCPSENIVIDRHVLMQSTITFTLNATGVPDTQLALNLGLTDALQSFPLQSLFTTAQATINNVSVSSNYQDILPQILRMNDKAILSRYNSLTPSNPDTQYGVYSDGVGANNNPLAGFSNNSYDDQYMPRGAFPIEVVSVTHNITAGGQDASLVSTNVADTFVIVLRTTVTEPFVALSPFINSKPANQAGLVGINNMSFVFNIDNTCKRFFSTSKNFITSISLGAAGIPNGFSNTRLLFNFLTLQSSSYAKIATKNTCNYLDYPRYITLANNNTVVAPGASTVLTSQSIQLNQVPDLIIIVARKPMANQTIRDPSAFMTIDGISVNFNNQSGLLASATQEDLYNISYRNGSSQSFYEFGGTALKNNNVNGEGTITPTIGSMLVLSPVYDLSLPDMLSASSLGQYQLQFNLRVTNQFPDAFIPELCIITVNSGLFSTVQGTSQIFTGILTKEMVLRTKEQNPVPHVTSDEYERLVGGRMGNRGMSNMAKLLNMRRTARAERMAGAVSGGVTSGGRSKLSKHVM